MKILSLESSAQTASAALCEDGELIALHSRNSGLTHSETLLPTIESLLGPAGFSVGDIDLFACAVGPGSFTGVRIGAATIKGLAFGRGKPCIGVSTLEALALNLIDLDGIICPVMNARRGQVYNALFDCRGARLTRLTPDRALSLDELKAELASLVKDPVLSAPAAISKIYLCGDGYDITRDALSALRPTVPSELLLRQNAYSVARLALELYRQGVRTTDAELAPVYLRMPQAERERLERLGVQ